MRTTIVRCVSDYEENNKITYTLGIERGNESSVRLSVTGTADDDNTKTMDMHATVKDYDGICCLYETLKAILKDLERETNYYEKEEEIRF